MLDLLRTPAIFQTARSNGGSTWISINRIAVVRTADLFRRRSSCPSLGRTFLEASFFSFRSRIDRHVHLANVNSGTCARAGTGKATRSMPLRVALFPAYFNSRALSFVRSCLRIRFAKQHCTPDGAFLFLALKKIFCRFRE